MGGIRGTSMTKDALDKKAENARELGLDYEPERTWVGLTAEEMEGLIHLATYMDVTDHIHMLMMAEAKLKEKNT